MSGGSELTVTPALEGGTQRLRLLCTHAVLTHRHTYTQSKVNYSYKEVNTELPDLGKSPKKACTYAPKGGAEGAWACSLQVRGESRSREGCSRIGADVRAFFMLFLKLLKFEITSV